MLKIPPSIPPCKVTQEIAASIVDLADSYSEKEISQKLSVPLSIVGRVLAGRYVIVAHVGSIRENLYRIWKGVVSRCLDEDCPTYPSYGGRGIKLCEAWTEFDAFVAWSLDNGYEVGLSIDRVDFDGDYVAGNCRWILECNQNRNKSNNKLLTCFGETKPMVMWSEDDRCKITYWLLKERIKRGWDVEEAITTPAELSSYEVTIFGETKSLLAWKNDPRCEVHYNTLTNRMRAGWPTDTLLFKNAKSPKIRASKGYVPSLYTAFGQTKTMAQWEVSKECAVNCATLRKRVKNGWSMEEALREPGSNGSKPKTRGYNQVC